MNNLPARHRKIAGFTLLEVLLAGFIMFLVLITMTEVYRGALLSSDKAEAALRIAGYVPSIHANVVDSFHKNIGSDSPRGEGQFGTLMYSWTAILTHEGVPSEFLIEDSGRKIGFSLWRIDLKVTDKEQSKHYSFTEMSW
tara:strand:- start:981 stop:1400 length:420 start_codon:yes stop_codon:yes gene_type:complete